MVSGRASRKASAVEDVGASIERWQADAVGRKDYETGTGPIGSLFNSITELLGLILVDTRKRSNMSQHYQSLESSSAALFFWGTDLGVARGELDEVLQDSAELRDTCLLVLVSIGHFMISSFVRLLSSKHREKEILDSTGISPSLDQAMDILDQQHYPTYQPDQNEEALCRTLRMKIDTLIMLGPSLASPAEESFDDEEPRAIEHVEEHLPEQTYINSVAQRFPLAESTVVTHLGKLNWNRYNHMLCLQRNANQQEQEMTVVAKAKTIFHDSALGSSMPAQSEAGLDTTGVTSRPQSIYAPSMVSSRAEASHRRLPPLPPQARAGQPFTCAICNKQVRYQRTKAWKKHIFEDILAYACLFTECSVANVFFEDRDAMMSHLEERHGLDVSISKVTCPLCIEYTSGDRDALSLHFARHMEEIALVILPSGVDSDDESTNDTPSETDTQIEERTSIGKGIEQADENTNNKAYSSIDVTYLSDSSDGTDEEEVTRCVCGHQDYPGPKTIDSGIFIQCDTCKVWQHGGCVGILQEYACPDEYFCEECRKDLHKVTENSKGLRFSQYLPVGDSRSLKPKEKAKHGPSSYWRVAELQDFETNIARFGTDWLAIANHMGTKTQTMVKNHYLRLVEQGRTDLEEIAKSKSAHPTPLNQFGSHNVEVLAPPMGSRRRARVKSEPRSQSMTIWWAARKARKKEADGREILRLRRDNEEKEARLRQLEQAVLALGSREARKLDLEIAKEGDIQKEESGRPQSPDRLHESTVEELQLLRHQNQEKDLRLHQLEQAVMALQQSRASETQYIAVTPEQISKMTPAQQAQIKAQLLKSQAASNAASNKNQQ